MKAVVDEIELLDETLVGIGHSQKEDSLLANAVVAIGNHFAADVCSIYLMEGHELVLRATVGLLRSSIGQVRMSPSEGLVGLVAERVTPFSVASADKHPRFKYFPQAGEEIYESFLGAPMIAQGRLIGVVVVQTVAAHEFSVNEQIALGHAAERIARQWAVAHPLAWRAHKLATPTSVSTSDRETPSPSISKSLSDEELSTLRSRHRSGTTRTALAIDVLENDIAASGRSLSEVPLDEAKTSLVKAYRKVDDAISGETQPE